MKRRNHAQFIIKAGIRLLMLGALAAGLASPVLAKSWKIIVMGDMRGDNKAGNVLYVTNSDGSKTGIGFKDKGITEWALKDMATAIKNEGPDVVLVVGDLVSKWIPQINGKDADTLMGEEFALWAQIWNQYSGGTPVFPVRGNQEWIASNAKWFEFIQGLPGIGSLHLNGPPGEEGLSYSFHYKNVLFVAIDQYVGAPSADSPTITPAALAWLQEQFIASDRPHVFVFGHAPAYEVYDSKPGFRAVPKDGLPSPAVYNPVSNIWDVAMNAEAVKNVRNPFWSILGSEGAGAYFCGHDHVYARGVAADINGNLVRQVIIGNGGAPGTVPWKAVYNSDPFIESAGRNTPFCYPVDATTEFCSPMIQVESFDQPQAAPLPTKIGYVVVEMQGSKAKATYKAEAAPGGTFVSLDSWSWKVVGDDAQ